MTSKLLATFGLVAVAAILALFVGAAPPVSAQAPDSAPFVVSNTEGAGAILRTEPGGTRLKVWPDGTQVTPLGEQVQAEGRRWTKVRDPDGNVGWVASEFLSPAQSTASAPLVPSVIPSSSESEIPATPNPGEGGRTPRFSPKAIWDWYQPSNSAALKSQCGVEQLNALNPITSPRNAGCILEGMRAAGASTEATTFFESTQRFLVSFNELGQVDIGGVSAPWLNMGRSEAVFLNGTPPAILLYSALDTQSRTWEKQPDYAALLRRSPGAFPWIEYGRMGGNENRPDGSQRIVLEFPMKTFRAGPDVAWMPVAFVFDSLGVLVSSEILSPKPS